MSNERCVWYRMMSNLRSVSIHSDILSHVGWWWCSMIELFFLFSFLLFLRIFLVSTPVWTRADFPSAFLENNNNIKDLKAEPNAAHLQSLMRSLPPTSPLSYYFSSLILHIIIMWFASPFMTRLLYDQPNEGFFSNLYFCTQPNTRRLMMLTVYFYCCNRLWTKAREKGIRAREDLHNL